jgi:hypothetical protein
MPPKVPQVTWDGKQLTIISDNSTLGDILTAIRSLTGTQLDMPPAAARERIAARLGPGPAREIISTLLSWTDFDYVIQASDAEPDGVHNVMLTARVKDDTRGGVGVVGDSPARSAYRRLARPNGSTEELPAPENIASAQPDSPIDPAPPGTQPASQDPQPLAAAQTPSGDAPATPTETPAALTDVASSSTTADSSSSAAPVSETEQRIQVMQNLYQQRKQMTEETRKPPAN